MRYYAGIGSRETPNYVLDIIEHDIAPSLAKTGFILRSGGARGADSAFERGCNKYRGKKEIWLPWPEFDGNQSPLVVCKSEAFELAEFYHPNWKNLTQGAKKLHARNMHQILGKDLKTPCNFVVCYTEEGKGLGGTSQALRVAKDRNIPIFDLGNYRDKKVMIDNFNLFRKEVNK